MPETTDLQRLIIAMEARSVTLERQLARASSIASKRATEIESRFQRTNSVLAASFTRLGAIVGAGFSLRAAQQLIDTSTRIRNSLRVAGLEGEELTRVYDDLFASAQRNAAPLESLVELYARAALSQKELGASSGEMLEFTDKVAVALRVAGRSAQESSGALLQLSQALGSGVVRAEELNSLLEGAQPIAQAAAAGLEEAGGSVAKLRSLVIDGKVSSEAFFRAFLAGSVILEDKVAGAELTVSQQFVRLQNVLADAAGKLDQIAGAGTAAGSGLGALADGIQALVNNEDQLRSVVELVERLVGAFAGAKLGRMVGGGPGAVLGGTLGVFGPEIFDTTHDLQLEAQALKRVVDQMQAGVAAGLIPQESLDNTKQRLAEIEQELIKVSQAAALVPASAPIGLTGDPTPGATSASATVNQVTLADYPVSSVGDAVKGTTTAVKELYDNLEVTRDLTADWLTAFVDGLLDGQGLMDSLSDAAKRLASVLVTMGINTITGSIFPTPGAAAGLFHSGGTVGADRVMRSVSPLAFAGALRMHGGGIAGLMSDEVPAILQRGERVLARGESAGGVTINYAPRIDARGADRAGIDRLSEDLRRQVREELPAMIKRARANRELN